MSKVSNDKRFQIWLAVFSVIAPFVITAIIDKWKNLPIFSTIKDVWFWIWSNVFEHSFKLWQILLFMIVILVLIVIIVIIQIRKQGKSKPEASWFMYQEDKFEGIGYKWSWEKHFDGKYYIENLRPICSSCGTPMRYDSSVGPFRVAKCPRCNNRQDITKDDEEIRAIILDNCDRELFKKDMS